MVEHFDPVDMTLAEIEAQKGLGQADLARIAEAKRAEGLAEGAQRQHGPPNQDASADFVELTGNKDWAAVGELVDRFGGEEDELGEFEDSEEEEEYKGSGEE